MTSWRRWEKRGEPRGAIEPPLPERPAAEPGSRPRRAEGRVRRLIGIVVVGQLLAEGDLAVIKGASNIEVRVGTGASRVSRDLDAIHRSTLEGFREGLAEALREGWSGFTGVLVDEGEIALPLPDEYRPHRYRAKLQFQGRDFGSLVVEVSTEEIGALRTVDRVAAREAGEWFRELGLPAPGPVPALPLEHQIAQKLHACTSPDADGWVNDRAHDLVDLQLAMRTFGGSLPDIREAAMRLFASRRSQTWPPVVRPRPGWEDRYAAEADGLEVFQGLDDAVAWAKALIADIDRG